MKYIDIHGHINFEDYDSDRKEVIEKAYNKDVSMIVVGTDRSSSLKAVELAGEYSNIYACIGLHPICENKDNENTTGISFDSEKDFFSELAKDDKVVAIGESGLDYFHGNDEDFFKQSELFNVMIDVANESKKPLMLHLRNGKGRSAYIDAFAILKENSKVNGNLHFFAGNIEEAKKFLDMGYYFSFTGAITYGDNYVEIIKYLPLEHIMSETDCPYVAPVPYRGKRSDPSHVIEVVNAIAYIKGLDREKTAEQLVYNAKKFFSLN